MHTHTALAVKAPRLQSSQISPAHTLCPSYNPRFMPSPPLQSPTLSAPQAHLQSSLLQLEGGPPNSVQALNTSCFLQM